MKLRDCPDKLEMLRDIAEFSDVDEVESSSYVVNRNELRTLLRKGFILFRLYPRFRRLYDCMITQYTIHRQYRPMEISNRSVGMIIWVHFNRLVTYHYGKKT